uniref:Uncharacterized protein n=1 Tax=Arundo donax TaxID=35708 RepID=A0A0A9DTQ2_ARUDO
MPEQQSTEGEINQLCCCNNPNILARLLPPLVDWQEQYWLPLDAKITSYHFTRKP